MQAFEKGDNVAIERLCRELTVPSSFYYPPPASLRVPNEAYLIVTGVDAMRKLFQLEELSPQSVCRALDNFASSPNNLQSVFRHILDAYITELLPIASDICNDYNNVINFLTDGRDQELTVEVTDLISKYLGFTNRKDLCRMISDGIDGESGRAKDDSTSFFVDEALMVFTNKKRCTEIIDRSKVFFRDTTDADEFIKLVTGYATTETLCESMTSSFADECSGTTATRIYSPFVMLVMLLASGVFCSLYI
ncbi:scavenger receptor cysteine-rich protein precursor [Apostichopus japonicus]|uniref:Scavenger receptor cysteine-rich protein n=1 Tax=Stichopus japonicus TaxID=307972 RepID=A0A2G8L969_STIJA|nr:scavenger receptor cysteine-rich protein precursor [Apostichopus japonicus]